MISSTEPVPRARPGKPNFGAESPEPQHNPKFMRLSAFFLFFAVAIVGCQSENTPIRIGATMSQTGSTSIQGIAAQNGYLLCEQHINEDGGVLGRPISFLIYDDESSNEMAIKRYEKLITKDKVDLIMGPYGSTLTEAVAPVTEKHQFVHISPLAATSSIWEQGRSYLFMILPPAELFLAGLIDLADDQSLKRVAIIQEDALFPRAAGDGAAHLARDRGMEVLFHETYPRGMESFRSLVQRIEQENIEVVAMAASTLNDFVRFVQTMHDEGVSVEMFGTSGAVDQFADALGEIANGTFGLSAWEPSVPNPGVDRFLNDYVDRFGIQPSFHAAGAYGACQVLIEAVQSTSSLNQTTLRDALLELQTTTVLSDYAVDERGYQTANTGLFIQWQDGRKVVVWP